MRYKGVVKGHVIAREGEATLPEGTRVSIMPEPSIAMTVPQPVVTLKEWLQDTRQVRAHLPKTSDKHLGKSNLVF